MADAVAEALLQYDKYKSKITNHNYAVAINMAEPSYRKRLYVIDLKTKSVDSAHHVAHGVNSSNPVNRAYATSFSNVNMSKKSSLGAMITKEFYYGKHGKSLRLQGLEKGINDNVYKRAIVFHGSSYVSDAYIMKNGRAGQSWGCPAVDEAIKEKLYDKIKGGAFIYVYYK